MPKRSYNEVVSTTTTDPVKRARVVKTVVRKRGPLKRSSMNMRTGGFIGRFKGPNRETKFFDTAINSAVDATGEVPTGGQLVLIPQGDTESARDGRMAYIKSVHGRFLLNSVPALNASGSTNVFLYLVLDTQCNGAAASVTDVFTSANLWSAFHNLANSDRFRILRKFRVNLTSQANQSASVPSNTNKCLEFYYKCNIPIQYSSTTGAIGEIKSNNLFYILGSDGQSDDTVTMNGTTRVRFLD